MNNSYSIIDTLVNHFETNGWPLDLNYEKLMARWSASTDKSEPDCKIVEILRHRSILGGFYRKGLPMATYETYFMRYAINLSTGQVKELPEQSIDCEINFGGLVAEYFNNGIIELKIDQVDEIHYRVSNGVSKEEIIVKNIEEAKQFILNITDPMVNYFNSDRLNSIEDSLKAEYSSEYEKHLKEALVNKIEELWINKDL